MVLEVVVRPAIFPNIRPTARQSLPPQDDPTKGFAVIRGQPASAVELSWSRSVSSSHSNPTEKGRTVDEMRVYQKGDDGEVNKDNFVDIQVPTQIDMNAGPARGNEQWRFNRMQESENIEARRRSIRAGQGFVD